MTASDLQTELQQKLPPGFTCEVDEADGVTRIKFSYCSIDRWIMLSSEATTCDQPMSVDDLAAQIVIQPVIDYHEIYPDTYQCIVRMWR